MNDETENTAFPNPGVPYPGGAASEYLAIVSR